MGQVASMDRDVRQVYRSLFSELDATISRVQRAQTKVEQIETLVLDLMLSELAAGKITAYNASTSYANLVNSVCKLERLKLEIVDRLNGAGPLAEPEVENETNTQQKRDLEELSELLLTHAVKRKMETDTGRKLRPVSTSGA